MRVVCFGDGSVLVLTAAFLVAERLGNTVIRWVYLDRRKE